MTRRAARATIIVLAVAAALLPLPHDLIDRWYSQGIYPFLQHALTPASNLVPFALFDLLLVAAICWLAVVVYRRIAHHGFRRGALRLAVELVTAAASVYLVFLATWGMNYRRTPLIERVAFDPSRVNRDALLTLGDTAAGELNRLYGEAHAQPAPLDAVARSLADVQHAFGGTWTIVPGRPKQTLLGGYFHQASIAGMTDPFLLETMLAPDLLAVERPFVIAHEWAHLAGYADESEANFVAWLACRRGSAAEQYSAWLMTIGYARPRRPLRAALAIGPLSDLDAIAERYAHTNAAIRAAAREGYDAYLKANRVRAGVVSYDLVVQLILGTTLDRSGNPVLR